MPVSNGAKAALAIRPEKIWLYSPDSDAAQNNGRVALAGDVTDVIYIGTDTRYQVLLKTGDTLFVRVQNLGSEQDVQFAKGDAVSVQFSAENAQVLTE